MFFLDKTVTLVSGLNQGHHTITCLKMDEPRDAYTAVTSFETDGGFYERNTAQDNQKTKFMFVCASGGSGFGALSYSETNSNVEISINSGENNYKLYYYVIYNLEIFFDIIYILIV